MDQITSTPEEFARHLEYAKKCYSEFPEWLKKSLPNYELHCWFEQNKKGIEKQHPELKNTGLTLPRKLEL